MSTDTLIRDRVYTAELFPIPHTHFDFEEIFFPLYIFQTLYKTVQAWSTSLYNPQAVINAVDVRKLRFENNHVKLKFKFCFYLGQTQGTT